VSGEPTVLIVPGEPAAGPASVGVGGVALWALLAVMMVAGVWAGLNGRRRRRTDPRELAFRRLAAAQGWSRSQVRSLRRAAGALGLESPVALALSPTLTAGALGENRRGQSSGG
jgi:hypothetical protein